MDRTLKLISLLLSYPSHELLQSEAELLAAAHHETNLKPAEKKHLRTLIKDIASLDLYEAQERYVYLFDRTRTLSLHLFEHVHGESRDRGQAMVDLMSVYEENGMIIGEKELPDYLPLFLEYLATRPEAEAREMLSQTLHIVAALRERLKKRKSVYANAMLVLEAFARSKPDPNLVDTILTVPEDDPDDMQALDQVWEDEVVTFGGNAGENECGPDRLRRQLRAHGRREQTTTPTNAAR